MNLGTEAKAESQRQQRQRLADPKREILDVAERLFAEQGFAAVSVRDVTAEARVNVAAITYHFGSKEGLIRATIGRILARLNEERFARLAEAERLYGDKPVPVREILYAYWAPAMRYLDVRDPQQAVLELFTQVFVLPDRQMRRGIERDVSHTRRLLVYLARAVPGLSQADLCWGLHFASGIFHHNTILHLTRLKNFSSGSCIVEDSETLVRRAADFAAAGFEVWAAKAASRSNAPAD